MPLVDPLQWALLPFGDQTAWVDFLGAHALWHLELDQQIRENLGGDTFPQPNLGDGGGPEWDSAHQLVHDSESEALGIERGPDFQSYDRNQPEQFASWAFLHASDCVRLRRAAGV